MDGNGMARRSVMTTEHNLERFSTLHFWRLSLAKKNPYHPMITEFAGFPALFTNTARFPYRSPDFLSAFALFISGLASEVARLRIGRFSSCFLRVCHLLISIGHEFAAS
ncbi:hypothetical protein SLEP1_g35966 [Rubroshorea leprosula]|uniref:Uncharacterized protein n=1 Tax=Rubroshorea leprosula TaxID=152421 RepID=A0AAV5KQ46_9ROSI|nr:hypothetical protein SLEP1_g35966 [Rubroshorea leprosula]